MDTETNTITEFELAWLVNKLPDDLAKETPTKIKQGYLPSEDPMIKDIRVREKNGKYTYTVKRFLKNSKETGYCSEETKPLKREEFIKLWTESKKKTSKKRYKYPLNNGLIADIDVYGHNLSGLIVVEVEFPSIAAYKVFSPPAWFGKEVTDSDGIYPPVIADMTISEVNKINEEYVQEPHDLE